MKTILIYTILLIIGLISTQDIFSGSTLGIICANHFLISLLIHVWKKFHRIVLPLNWYWIMLHSSILVHSESRRVSSSMEMIAI